MSPGPAIEARGLARRFGRVQALRPLDLRVEAGETLAVLGPNGAGKSTLLRLLAGLARPSSGELVVAGDPRGRAERRRRVGLIAHATFLYPELSARENLWLVARLHGLPDAAERVARALHEQGLADFAERRAGTFSRGMAQRLAIARALLHDPPVLLLDEPFTGLDAAASERLASQLARARGARTTVLVTHDLERAAALGDRALVLVRGRGRGLPEAALGDGHGLAEAYREIVSRLEGRAG